MCCVQPMNCWPRKSSDGFATRRIKGPLDAIVAEDSAPHSSAAGVCCGGALFIQPVATCTAACRRGVEPGCGAAGFVVARVRLRVREEKPRAHGDGSVRAHA